MANKITFTYILVFFGLFLGFPLIAQDHFQRHSQIIPLSKFNSFDICNTNTFYKIDGSRCKNEVLSIRLVSNKHEYEMPLDLNPTNKTSKNNWTTTVTIHYNPYGSGVSPDCYSSTKTLTIGEEWNSHQPLKQTYIDSKIITDYSWQNNTGTATNSGIGLTFSSTVSPSTPAAEIAAAQQAAQQAYVEIEWYTSSSGALTGSTPFNFSHNTLIDKAADVIYWDYVEGAHSYELEWVFWDAYTQSNMLFPTSTLTGTLDSDFIKNPSNFTSPTFVDMLDDLPFQEKEAVRITTTNQHFELPLNYPAGILFYRVRPIGYWDKAVFPALSGHISDSERERKVGAWQYRTLSTNPNVPGIRQYSVLSEDFEPSKLWQAVTTFAEEGKFKKVISYLDGTSRMRQTVTHLNSDETVLVAEQFYSAEGAASVQILPVPLLSEGLHYRDNVNYFAKTVGTGISATTMPSRHKSAYEGTTATLHTDFGAGKYYSEKNPFLNSTNPIHKWYSQFTPDAVQGGVSYALSQTVMTNDNTQKVLEQGGVGQTFAIGGGHSTKYYYGTAAGDELTKLFGTNVGSARHYRKSLVQDANGQVSISYTNQEGKTVATALSDSNPANLETLDIATTPQLITVDLKDYQSVSIDGTELITEFNLLNSNTNNAYNFVYNNSLDLTICKECRYQIELKIIDNSTQLPAKELISGNPINIPVIYLGKEAPIGTTTPAPITSFTLPATAIRLPIGSYTVRKFISVTQPLSWIQTRDEILADFGSPTIPNKVPSLDQLRTAYNAAIALTGQCSSKYPGSEWLHNSLLKTAEQACNNPSLSPKEKLMCKQAVDSRVFVQKLSFITTWTEAKDIFGDNLSSSFYEMDPLFSHPIYGKPFVANIANLLGAVMVAPNKLPVAIDQAVLSSTANLSSTIANTQRWVLFKTLYIEAREKVYQQALIAAQDPKYTGPPVTATPPVIPLIIMEQKYWNWRNNNAHLFFQNDPVALATALTNFIASECTFINNTTSKATLIGLLTTYFTHQDSYKNGAKLINSNPTDNTLSDIKTFLNSTTTCVSATELLTVLFPNNTVTGVPQFYEPLQANVTSTNVLQTPKVLEQQEHLTIPSNITSNPFVAQDFYLQAPALADLDQSKYLSVEFVIDHLAWSTINMQNKSIESNRMVPLLSRKLQGSYKYRYNNINVPNPFLPTAPITAQTTIDLPYYFSVAAGVRETTDTEPVYDGDGNVMFDKDGKKITQPVAPAEQHYLVVHPFWFSPTIWKELNWSSIPFNGELDIQLKKLKDFKFEFPIQGGLQPCDQVKIVWEQMNCPAMAPGSTAPVNCKMIRGFSVYVNSKLVGSYNFPKRSLTTNLMNFSDFPALAPNGANCLPPVPTPPAVCFDAPWNRSGFSFDTQATWNFGGTWMTKLAVAAVPATSTTPARPAKDAQYGNMKGAIHSIAFRTLPEASALALGTVVARYEVINEEIGVNKNATLPFEPLTETLAKYDMKKGANTNWVISQCLAAPQPYQAYNAYKKYDLVTPPTTGAPSPLTDLLTDCETNRKAALKLRYETDFENELEKLTYLKRRTGKECMVKLVKNITENFKITYTSFDKHYTLYYYDQAQNLVATVPPDGVKINGNVSTRIDHTLMTHYAFNTIGQPIKQQSPDAGKTEFYYDKITRLRLSQNAEQAAQSALSGSATAPSRFIASYTQYDAIGRTIEVGQTSIINDVNTNTWVNDNITKPEFPKHNGTTVINTQITHTNYDNTPVVGLPAFLANIAQFGRNRITNTYTLAIAPTPDPDPNVIVEPIFSSQTWYAYDVHGNVKTLWQGVPGLETKKINYYYDLIAGKVNKVVYQPKQADQFIHRYRYDGDNRLIAAETSVDDLIYTQDASYFYYPHGPLARMELGHYKVQGLDYAYTLQGWLKGVNSIGEGTFTPTTTAQQGHHNPLADIGADGYGVSQVASPVTPPTTGAGFNNVINNNPTHHALVGRDVFAFSLHYFQGDYKASSFKHMTTATKDAMYEQIKMDAAWSKGIQLHATASTGTTDILSLYNGNIAMMNTAIHIAAGVTKLDAIPAQNGNPAIAERNIPKLSELALHQQMVYKYDQLNRIKKAQTAQTGLGVQPANATPILADAFKESYTYDGNGNIQKLTRKTATEEIDNLTYEYIAGTNQLRRVGDNLLYSNLVSNDIDNQADANNYVYDVIGNLIADKSEGIEKIEWTVYGKVARVVRKAKITPTTTTPASTNLLENYDDVIIEYSYDAMGNRISKTVKRREGLAYNEILGWTAGTDFLGTEKTTYYVRDAQGNVLSIYDKGAYFRYTNTGTVANPVWNTPTLIPISDVPVRGTTAGLAKTPVEILPPLPRLPLALTEQIIYGSARIGAYKPQRNQKLLATDPNRGKIMPILVGQLTLGYKSYELSNHLGNVLTTISDNKMMVITPPSGGGGLVYLQAVVLTTQDYYPFGKGMTERSYVNVDRNAQRYGFNGKENDEEWGGTIQDYGFRLYDPELGKFVSVDPISATYPFYSPYQFAGNSPILYIDLDGLEPFQGKDGQYYYKVKPGQGPTQIAADPAWQKLLTGTNLYMMKQNWCSSVVDPNTSMVSNDDGNKYIYYGQEFTASDIDNKNNEAYKQLNLNPGDIIKIHPSNKADIPKGGVDLEDYDTKPFHQPENVYPGADWSQLGKVGSGVVKVIVVGVTMPVTGTGTVAVGAGAWIWWGINAALAVNGLTEGMDKNGESVLEKYSGDAAEAMGGQASTGKTVFNVVDTGISIVGTGAGAVELTTDAFSALTKTEKIIKQAEVAYGTGELLYKAGQKGYDTYKENKNADKKEK